MQPTRLLEPLTRSDSDSGRIAVQGLRRVHAAVTDNDAPVPCTTAEIEFSSKVCQITDRRQSDGCVP